MKKRHPLKQSPLRKIKPAPDPFPAEVSFWLVKMDADLVSKIDARRKQMGHNKKTAVAWMGQAYLDETDIVIGNAVLNHGPL